MNRWHYDFEFHDTGSVITPISVGLVSDDGSRTYYAGFSDVDLSSARRQAWLVENVFAKLPSIGDKRSWGVFWKPREQVAKEILGLLGIVRGVATRGTPELWGDHVAYDHVALCQLYGPMIALPSGMPMFSMDLQQLIVMHGRRRSELPKQDPDLKHHALEDALHQRRCYRWLLGLDT